MSEIPGLRPEPVGNLPRTATLCACWDCGLSYTDPGWCDAVVPNDVWARISPLGDEGGLLCLTCMARRLVWHGLRDVPMIVTSGPFAPQMTVTNAGPSARVNPPSGRL